MTDLTKLAKHEECQIRLPGCTHDITTTVPAHYRLSGYCGTGMKPPDLPFMAFADFHCHEVADGRIQIPDHDRMAIRLAHAEGCLKTIHWFVENGYVGVLK